MSKEKKKISEIPHFIKKAIDREIEIAAQEEIEKAKEELSKRVPTIVADVALRLSSHVTIDPYSEKMLITIQNKVSPPPTEEE